MKRPHVMRRQRLTGSVRQRWSCVRQRQRCYSSAELARAWVVVVHCSAPTMCERPPAPYLRPVMFITLLKLVLPQRLRPYLAQLPSEVDASWFTDTDSCAQSVVDAEVLWL